MCIKALFAMDIYSPFSVFGLWFIGLIKNIAKENGRYADGVIIGT